MADWFYHVDGMRQGPVSELELQTLAAQGVIFPDTVISNEVGQSAYAKNVRGLSFPGASSPGMSGVNNMASPFPSPAPPPAAPSMTPPSMTPPPSSPYLSSAPAPHGSQAQAGYAASGGGKKIEFGEAVSQIPALAISNLPALLANVLCFVAVAWIPWINLGAMIGLFGICCKVTRPGELSFTEVLNPKYRSLLGNYVVLFSLMVGGILVVLVGMSLPMISFGILTAIFMNILPALGMFFAALMVIFAVLSALVATYSVFTGWILAPLLVCDKNMDPSEALSRSTERMEGYKLMCCLLAILFGVFFAILGAICGVASMFVPLLGILLHLCIFLLDMAFFAAMLGYFYGKLAADME